MMTGEKGFGDQCSFYATKHNPNNVTGGLPPGSARRAGPTVPTRSLATDLWRYTGMSPANMQLYLDWYVYLFRVNQARDRWDPTARVLRHMMMAPARFRSSRQPTNHLSS